MNPSSSTATPRPLSLSQAILFGGLTVGTLDILDATIYSYLRRGTAPLRVLQSVAGGLLGKSAYDGGWSTGALYGLCVYAVMYLVVLPLSANGAIPFTWPGFVNNSLIHMLGIGMPSVYFARRAVVSP